MDEIPIIDIENLLFGDLDDQKKVSQNLISAIKTYGFVYLKNYGISDDQVQDMFGSSKQFFDSDMKIKETATKNHKTFCGYDSMEMEKLSIDRPGDLKESYMIKQGEGTPWPISSELEKFKVDILEFHSKCYSLSMKLVKGLALGLDLDEHTFSSNFTGECTVLRLLHYPQTIKPILPNQLRCGEHTDYGALTLLFQDPAGGLEIKTKDKKWLPAPYIPNTIIMNAGDSMEMWTNGFLKSTPHRVVNPDKLIKNCSRYSSAFFFDPDLKCELNVCHEKFNGCNNTEFTAKTYKEHLFGIYDATYSDFNSKSKN